MPIYEFKCDYCGNIFEVITAVWKKKGITCPKCYTFTDHLLMSAPGKIENFEAYYEADIDDKPIFVRNKQDLKDAINKHNDEELADKVGKLRIYDA